MKAGQITMDPPDLRELRGRFSAEFAQLDRRYKRLRDPVPYQVTFSNELSRLHSGTATLLRERIQADVEKALSERA